MHASKHEDESLEALFREDLPPVEERMIIDGNLFDYRPAEYVENVSQSFAPEMMLKFNKTREVGVARVGEPLPPNVRVWVLHEQREGELAHLLQGKKAVLNFGSLS